MAYPGRSKCAFSNRGCSAPARPERRKADWSRCRSIELVGRSALGLEKNLMALLGGETVDLVFDRRANSAGRYLMTPVYIGERSRPPRMISCVRGLVWRDPAGQLPRMHLGRTEKREHRHRLVARLRFHHREIDRAPSRRGGVPFSGARRAAQLAQVRRQTDRGRISRGLRGSSTIPM